MLLALQVLVGGKPATMPLTEGYTTVNQDKYGHVNITGGDHFSIDYDLTVDHMAIQISGWYHGKTGGLLGIFDNEPSNDLMSSYNKVVGNSARFARTWDVGTTSCRWRDKFTIVKKTQNRDGYNTMTTNLYYAVRDISIRYVYSNRSEWLCCYW